MRSFAAFFLRDLFYPAHQIEILLEVLSLKARRESSVVVCWKICEPDELAGEKAAPERAVSDEANAELAAGGEDLVFGIAGPQRVFGLQRGNGMDFHRTAQGLRRGLGKPDVADFAFPYKLCHRPDSFFDRRSGIDAMLIVQIDRLHPQPLQTSLTGAPDVIGLTVNPAHGGIRGVADDSEFRGQHNFFALVFDGAAD